MIIAHFISDNINCIVIRFNFLRLLHFRLCRHKSTALITFFVDFPKWNIDKKIGEIFNCPLKTCVLTRFENVVRMLGIFIAHMQLKHLIENCTQRNLTTISKCIGFEKFTTKTMISTKQVVDSLLSIIFRTTEATTLLSFIQSGRNVSASKHFIAFFCVPSGLSHSLRLCFDRLLVE